MKTLVILPVYNECNTLPITFKTVLEAAPFHVLVIEDNSTDGTREVARGLTAGEDRADLIERPGKLGLGTAYIEGFRWGLERGYDCFIEMDSDLSHDPRDLPRFLEAIESGSHLTIGSRYIGGTISVVGWDFKRLLLSKFGNFYAHTILGLPLTDMTSGFRAYSRKALESLRLEGIRSEGYAFQIEMAYYVWASGLKVTEIPIIFTERATGASKMSKKIIREAIRLPWRLRFSAIINTIKNHLGIKNSEVVKR
ncbi:MAG: glycosyltransferase [candidate division Zixibacteria bacterium]|nr:polyprenol monophosphomannose synthase [candidate division Zixibacteria bacterium]NIS49447.1 polyprenol monophosphomannose synthase [candidate division Zixibacteria bacterium]NIU17529.1 polyprenol monophosphomannose synthase [candidate division Zixibacteria bacterium]NIV09678.1 glycosyltransferase [candidate division Zixibacteria bacterium]NIW42120.1 glycosyltransferase [candidate division Zixibacteria bacterium]